MPTASPYQKFIDAYQTKRDAIVAFLDSEGSTFGDYDDLFNDLDAVIVNHVIRPPLPLHAPLAQKARSAPITPVVDPA